MSAQSIEPPDFLHPPSGPAHKALKAIAVLLMLGAVIGVCYASFDVVMALAHYFGYAS